MKSWQKFIVRTIIAILIIGRIDVMEGPPPDIFWAGIIAGVLVLLIGKEGTRITVKIIPLSPDGIIRIKTFYDAQPTGIYPWRYSLNVDGSANFWTTIPLAASETFSVFVRLMKWRFNEYLDHPYVTSYSLTVESGKSKLLNTAR